MLSQPHFLPFAPPASKATQFLGAVTEASDFTVLQHQAEHKPPRWGWGPRP